MVDPDRDDPTVEPSDLYQIAVDEYRFQAQFNWARTQYLLALNVAVLAAATAVASTGPGQAAALVFALGAVAATAGAAIVKVQHGYYRAARNHLRRVEDTLRIPPDQRLDTTPALGGRRRTITVNHLVQGLLAALAVADITGAALILTGR